MDEEPVKMHGELYRGHWQPPKCVTEFDVNARLTFTSIKAHEYYDREDVLNEKVELLAELIRGSNNCMAYTGAGISTAAGIDDYATKSKEKSVTAEARPSVRDWKQARPTKAHHVMTSLHRSGHLKHWIQQNHDSLPQKAGYPQHALNEIHGSLHDPANSVVPYEGQLRDDLYAWLQKWEIENDLCLALGTSLSGFNADRVVETAFQRCQQGLSAGLVIVNLQQTPYDEHSSLRIFSKIDTVMELLAVKLGLSFPGQDYVHVPEVAPDAKLQQDVFLVPFDEFGDPSQEKTVWDLRQGKAVKLTGGPYAGDIGRIVGKNEDGHYRIRFEDSLHPTFK
eukprot:gene20999-25196_t